MNRAQRLLKLIELFDDYAEYKNMLSKYVAKDVIERHDSFIRKSFHLQVSIPNLATDLKKLDNKN